MVENADMVSPTEHRSRLISLLCYWLDLLGASARGQQQGWKERRRSPRRQHRVFFLITIPITWLDRLSRTPAFGQDDPNKRRSPRPFVDRIHNWTFRLDPKVRKPFNLPFWSCDRSELLHYVILELYDMSDMVQALPHYKAVDAAGLLYGGLQLLAWNAGLPCSTLRLALKDLRHYTCKPRHHSRAAVFSPRAQPVLP